mgnify:CR=1 FL=1
MRVTSRIPCAPMRTSERPCLRYQQILMEYQDEQLQRHVQRFSGFTAQVIQHEVDHLEGIII